MAILSPIEQVARELTIDSRFVIPWGRNKAKIDLSIFHEPIQKSGRLILVSSVNPTPAGEGKTTTSIGLAMAMRRLGANIALCLREPSLGPVFGIKGGGTGGGQATLEPADDINLHFTGDIHAITSAHNLLSALIDNHLHFGQHVGDSAPFDARRIRWGRVLDMNDRSLREVMIGLGGVSNGVPRADRFDITAASEVMAIAALARNYVDLEARLSSIYVGDSIEKKPVFARDVRASGAMTALLRDAFMPNLVQTAEGGPALVHLGPFANIAHGCNSVIATQLGMKLSDYVVTEAGFGSDLGAEKFFNIKCRALDAWPRVVVLVVTVQALKMHGGVALQQITEPNMHALEQGFAHLEQHIMSIRNFGVPVVVALNVFPADSKQERIEFERRMSSFSIPVAACEAYSQGSEGALALARTVIDVANATDACPPTAHYSYSLEQPLEQKIQAIATQVYGATHVEFSPVAQRELARCTELGFGHLPICMAKTHLSLSDEPTRIGRPKDFKITIREVRLASGAGYIIALTGEMLTMPGLPKTPAANRIHLLANGQIAGLMQENATTLPK